ncbi:MAG: hypothetical protein GY925_03525 [Actinomycetia bacterium]|nr:hypothetical protein [Actinomycetes bacterium]
MTTDLFEDLGQRLDRLADVCTRDIDVHHPAGLSGAVPAASRTPQRLVLAAVAVAAVFMVAVVLALRPGSSVRTEDPTDEPQPTITTVETGRPSPGVVVEGLLPAPTMTAADLPAVFSLPPMEKSEPYWSLVGSAPSVDRDTARHVSFAGGDLFVGLDPDGHRVCASMTPFDVGGAPLAGGPAGCLPAAMIVAIDVMTSWHGVRVEGGESVGTGMSQPGSVVGLVPRGTQNVTVEGLAAEVIHDTYFAEVDGEGPAIEVQLADGSTLTHEAPSRNRSMAVDSVVWTIDNGTELSRDLDAVGCVRHLEGWDVFAAAGDGFSLSLTDTMVTIADPDGTGVSPSQVELVAVVASDADELGLRLDLSWQGSETRGGATIHCGVNYADIGIFAAPPRAMVPLVDLLPGWVQLPPTEPSGPLAGRVVESFDVSTLREVQFEDGAVYVGLDPEGTQVMVVVAPGDVDGEVGGGQLIPTRLAFSHLFGLSASTRTGSSFPDSWTVAGTAPKDVVAVTIAGHQAEFRSGVFYLRVEEQREGLGGAEIGQLLDSVDFHFADGSTRRSASVGVEGQPGGRGTASFSMDGTDVDVALTEVACALRGTGPPTLEFIVASEPPITGPLGPEDEIVVARLVQGELLLDALGGPYLHARIEGSDLDIQLADNPTRAYLEWDTDGSSGQLSIECGTPILDIDELTEILRLG